MKSMTDWTQDELARIGDADELDISSYRPNVGGMAGRDGAGNDELSDIDAVRSEGVVDQSPVGSLSGEGDVEPLGAEPAGGGRTGRIRALHTQILKRLTEVHRVDRILSGWQTALVGLVSLPAYVRRPVSCAC